MKVIEWLRGLNPWRARPKKTRSDNMRCSCCRRNIHKGERYTIEQARHRDCADPKMVGQKSFDTRIYEESQRAQRQLYEPRPQMINGEQVNISPAASMGTELIGMPAPLPTANERLARSIAVLDEYIDQEKTNAND